MGNLGLRDSHVLFNGLSASEIQTLVSQLRVRQYAAGQYIFDTGQPATCLFLLTEGLVRVGYVAPDGDYAILDVCEEGDIFGEMFLGEYRFRIGQAQAMTDVCLHLLHEDELYNIIRHYPQVSINFIQYLSDSKRRVFARLHALQRTEAKARVLGTLLSLARKMCCKDGVDFVLNPAISQQDIADMAGLNRSTVSSLINRLREEDILGGSGRYLMVNMSRMENLLGEEGFELVE